MTNKDIQQLIDRFLEGETSPEEEKVLAQELLREHLPSEWQAIRLMLGELAMGEAEYDAMMAKRQQTANRKARIVSMKWRWTAVAASLLLLIGTATLLLMKENDMQKTEQPLLVVADKSSTQQMHHVEEMTAQPLPSHQGEGCPKGGAWSVTSTPQVKVNHREEKIQAPPLTPPLDGRGVAAHPSTSNLHYASLETTTDTVSASSCQADPYQDPARVDEFISKLASVHALPIELTCSATMDSTVASAVYVFPDKKEVDVFGRLLQVACCYSDETPGYQLNFSHLQFFFQLKDMRLQLQYLWIAERVNGKILLYSTHSPIDANVSSACYQEYRDELMHARSIHTKTLDI